MRFEISGRAMAITLSGVLLSSCGDDKKAQEQERAAAYNSCIQNSAYNDLAGFSATERARIAKRIEAKCADDTVYAGNPDFKNCLAEKGFGNWVGSSGVTLEKFCQGAVALQNIEQDKREHPERY